MGPRPSVEGAAFAASSVHSPAAMYKSSRRSLPFASPLPDTLSEGSEPSSPYTIASAPLGVPQQRRSANTELAALPPRQDVPQFHQDRTTGGRALNSTMSMPPLAELDRLHEIDELPDTLSPAGLEPSGWCSLVVLSVMHS